MAPKASTKGLSEGNAMNLPLIGFTVVIFCLAGCSTTHIRADSAIPISHDLVYVRDLSTPALSSGHVIIVRDKGFLGSGCNFDVYLDTTRIATLKTPGTEVDIYPKPGNYVLSVSSTTAVCTNNRAGVNINVIAGATLIYDLSQFSEGNMELIPAAD